MADKIRVVRIIEYVGSKEWVDMTISRSITGTLHVGGTENSITAITVGESPLLPHLRVAPLQEVHGSPQAAYVTTALVSQAARRLAGMLCHGAGDAAANVRDIYTQLCIEFGIKEWEPNEKSKT